MDIKQVKIISIGLSNRSANALRRAGINTVGEMLKCNDDSLRKIRFLGEKSIAEILGKIEEYRELDDSPDLFEKIEEDALAGIESDDYENWLKTPNGKAFLNDWLILTGTKIDELEALSAKAYNVLLVNGYEFLRDIVFWEKDELLQIPRMDSISADEIIMSCHQYLLENKDRILKAYNSRQGMSSVAPKLSLREWISLPKNRETVLKYVSANDLSIRQMSLSNRPKNRLINKGYQQLSDIIFLTDPDLLRIPNMGVSSVEEIIQYINRYLSENEVNIIAVCNGDESAIWDDSSVKKQILGLYQNLDFGGLSFKEIREKLPVTENQLSDQKLKTLIGQLINEEELEYVDFRCYRVYQKFSDYFDTCPKLDEREKSFIECRLKGDTLEDIGADYNITRERVRQVVQNGAKKARNYYFETTGMKHFDEDYYRYFCENYAMEKADAREWLGISTEIYMCLEIFGIKRGKKPIQEALEDHENLDAGLRLKVQNFLNRNKLYIDDTWVEKNRGSLEDCFIRTRCREDVSFDEFYDKYNEFLNQEGIDYDEDLYYTEAVLNTRKNRLSESKLLLWKLNGHFRFYDIDDQDYTELLNELNLSAYENIEFSTEKLMREHSDIMRKYDIRDAYELHNLLRKTIPEGSFHELCFGRMPTIRFGEFDRKAAVYETIVENAPISSKDLANLLSEEYGYDPIVITANHLSPFGAYYHHGVYTMDQKIMKDDNAEKLKEALTGDFYTFDEIRAIYEKLIPGADPEEINKLNLGNMGVQVYSGYILQHYDSLDSYFEDILAKEDIVDITLFRKRFVYIPAFSSKLMELKRNLEVIEFEPNQIINFRKLVKSGVTREMIYEYCEQVYSFVGEEHFFSAQSLKKSGFESELYELGFSDLFYANILLADERFSFNRMYGNLILYTGEKKIKIQDFLVDRVKAAGIIDIYDLLNELADDYGCTVADKWDVIYKLRDTEVYYDSILDRLYANAELYYQEVDEMESL